jgi:hypothetical protein
MCVNNSKIRTIVLGLVYEELYGTRNARTDPIVYGIGTELVLRLILRISAEVTFVV